MAGIGVRRAIAAIPLPLAACWLIGLVGAWIVDFAYLPAHPVQPDEFRFLASALRLADRGWFMAANGRAWEMPLTAIVFAVIGPKSILAIRLVQSFLVPAQSWLVFDIGKRLFERRPATFAACVAAVYPFFLYYQGLALSETLFTALLLAFVALLYRWGGKVDFQLILTAAAGALALYVKATLTFLPPVLLALRARPRVALIALLIYVGFLAPWWVRNYVLLHSFVPFTTSASIDLYVGNNPMAVNGRGLFTGNTDPAEMARIEALPDEVARSKAYLAVAETFIVHNPRRFLHLCWMRLGAFWNVIPNATEYRGGIFPWISALTFGPVMALALVGAWTSRRDWRRLAPLYALIAYFTVVHSLTIASLRYRLPIEPYLILFAGAGGVAIRDALRRAMPAHAGRL